MSSAFVPAGAGQEIRCKSVVHTTDHSHGMAVVRHVLSVVVGFWWKWESPLALELTRPFAVLAHAAVHRVLGGRALPAADTPTSGVSISVDVAACQAVGASLVALLTRDNGPPPALVTVQVGVIPEGGTEPADWVALTLRPEDCPTQTPQGQGPSPSDPGA